jgi:hypothetical protein
MERRKQILAALLLVAAGLAAGYVFAPWIAWGVRSAIPKSAAEWDEQVRQDATTLVRDVLAPDLPDELASAPEFRARWDVQRAQYTPERLADLRRRLGTFFDFVVAESADCAEIYRLGRGAAPEKRSDTAEAARKSLRADFGEFAATLEAQADEQREVAFQASPKTAGFSEDLPDFRQQYDDLLEWLPGAKLRADELTRPAP